MTNNFFYKISNVSSISIRPRTIPCPQLAKSGCQEIKDDVYLIRNLKEIYMHGIKKKNYCLLMGIECLSAF